MYSENGKIRTAIADDHGIIRDSLRFLIKRKDNLEIVGEASNGAEAVSIACEYKPDVMLMDLKMPVKSGIQASKEILEASDKTRILVFSGELNKINIDQGVKIGIKGFILKDSLFTELVDAIEMVAQNKSFFCTGTRRIILNNRVNELQCEESAAAGLSEMDYEIIRLISDGLTINQIAYKLNRSSKTIDARKRTVMSRLGISSTAEVIKFAIKNGITSLSA